MDRGLFATWYDLPATGEADYLSWLHTNYLPAMLRRPGYLWAAHVRNGTDPEREAHNERRLVHTMDPAVGSGFHYLLMFGADDPHRFFDPAMEDIAAELDETGRRMLAMRQAERSAVFADAGRVEGPSSRKRAPGITPGPVIQFGTFNINDGANETEMNAWYARSRLPLVEAREGNIGARRLVTLTGWPKHGILYEFETLEHASRNLVDPSDWTRRVVDNLVHAPHSPTLGVRIWPEV